MTTVTSKQLFRLLILSVLGSALVGCGGSGDSVDSGSNSGYHFNTSNLHCPDDSLIISKSPPPFPDGSDVTFHNRTTGTDYDAGGGVANADGLVTGMPNAAPSGSYDVIVTPPAGTAVNTGEVVYSANGC